VLGVALPAAVAACVDADRVAWSLAAHVQQAWRAEPSRSAGVWRSAKFPLRTRERWQDRVRYCVAFATTPTPGDWSLLLLPRCLFPLYYPLRAIRLVAKYGAVGRGLTGGSV
jgi:hypothetical protein